MEGEEKKGEEKEEEMERNKSDSLAFWRSVALPTCLSIVLEMAKFEFDLNLVRKSHFSETLLVCDRQTDRRKGKKCEKGN